MMLSLFFQCPGCREAAPSPETLPLCADCAASLVASPALCAGCASPTCGGACSRPWVAPGAVASYSARYLMVGPGYRVLRRWKINSGTVFDRHVLNADARLRAHFQSLQLTAVTQIPQALHRSWRLGSSPAEKIARWASRELGVPQLSALRPARAGRQFSRQAELGMSDRLRNRIHFDFNEDCQLPPESRLLLVDDFMTTGQTLRAAASVLRSRGASRVHVFTLGVRPLRSGDTLRVLGHGDLSQRQIQSEGHLIHRA
jgi:predicted amidophosphoribosyltransferase